MLTLLALTSAALADVTNGPDDCAIEYYDSAHCEVCSDAYYDDEDACKDKLDDELDFACSTDGGSVWDEIWCEPGYDDPTSSPEEEKGCSLAASGVAPAGLGFFALLTFGFVARRRRA